jgi:hypothetical protein
LAVKISLEKRSFASSMTAYGSGPSAWLQGLLMAPAKINPDKVRAFGRGEFP